jgi:rhodanese-related sulfurtransferase
MQQFSDFVANNLILFGLLIGILVMLLRTWITPAGMTRLSPMQAVGVFNKGDALVLDVRTQQEFEEGHVLDAVNIPLGFLDARTSEIQNYKSLPVILVCQSGNRSAQAAAVLKKQGFTNLNNMEGGMLAWKNANLPVTTKATKLKSGKGLKTAKKQADADQEVENSTHQL